MKFSVSILTVLLLALFLNVQSTAQDKSTKKKESAKKECCKEGSKCCKDGKMKSVDKKNHKCTAECNHDHSKAGHKCTAECNHEKAEACNLDKAMSDNDSDKKMSDKKVNTTFNEVCPVRGNTVDNEAPTVSYNDKVIGFCCKGCDKKFSAEPEKYMKNLSKDGKKFIKNK